MLHAIERNKAGRNIQNEVNWRELFRTSEDSLTAMVFSRLLYLPVHVFWKILKDSCTDKSFPERYGSLESFEFWPHWNSLNTDNSKYVEPDLFIRFTEFDLIIEAKRWDGSGQSAEQWKNELLAYFNEYADEKVVYFLAVGGNENISSENTVKINKNEIKVFQFQWSEIMNNCKRSKELLNSENNLLLILNDTLKAFSIHGFFTGEWFESFKINEINEKSFKSIIKWKPKN